MGSPEVCGVRARVIADGTELEEHRGLGRGRSDGGRREAGGGRCPPRVLRAPRPLKGAEGTRARAAADVTRPYLHAARRSERDAA